MNWDYTFDSFPLALCVCVCMRSGCWWGFALAGRNTLYWNWHAVTFHQRLERPPPLNSVCERCSFYECNSAVSLVPEEKSDLSLSAQHNRDRHTNILLAKTAAYNNLYYKWSNKPLNSMHFCDFNQGNAQICIIIVFKFSNFRNPTSKDWFIVVFRLDLTN